MTRDWINPHSLSASEVLRSWVRANTHLGRKHTRTHTQGMRPTGEPDVNSQECKGVRPGYQGNRERCGGITRGVPRPNCNPLLGFNFSLLKGAPGCMCDPDFPFGVGVCCLPKDCLVGTSLMVQWLRVCTSTAGGTGSIPSRRLRSHLPCSAAKKRKKILKQNETKSPTNKQRKTALWSVVPAWRLPLFSRYTLSI